MLLLLAMIAARTAAAGDTILLLGARSFGHQTRVAELLNDMVSVTDVLGPARFEVVEVSGPTAFAAALSGRDDLRAVIALVGDLSLMTGVDPSVWPPPGSSLTSRRVDFDTDLTRLRAACDAAGTPLVIATAPLGRQGRVEVPELLDVHAQLRQQGPVFDLARTFAALEPAPLFTNGIDTLDEFGHEELARAIHAACLDEQGPLPPRTDDERAARAEGRALQALYRGDLEAWPALVEVALASPPTTPRHAARQAALASWRDGLDATSQTWAAIEPGADEVPGLAVGRRLASRSPTPGPSGAPSGDSVARRVLEVFETLAATRDDPGAATSARVLAEQLLDDRPDRLDAWLALQVVSTFTDPGRDLREEARGTLARFPRSAVSLRTVDVILARWPRGVDALPALLVAARPYARLRPTGPLLEAARRREALGLQVVAGSVLERGMADGRFPRTWRAERERLTGN